jgi:hypothetical protein
VLEGALSSVGKDRRLGLVPVHLHGHHHRVELAAAHAGRVLIKQVRVVVVVAQDARMLLRLMLNDATPAAIALIELSLRDPSVEQFIDVDLLGGIKTLAAPVAHHDHERWVAHRQSLTTLESSGGCL